MPGAVPEETFGDYRLTHLLGKGGMASVFRAVRSGPMGFAKVVAIKRLHQSLADNDQVLKSLINEARLGGQLKHRNIVEVYEFNKVGDAYYLAMEFVDGWTLDRVVKLSQEFELPIPVEVVLDILIQVCEGLEYAHNIESLEGEEVRLVHRDLKPANIILGRDGVVKVMDFGIAKAATNLYKTTLADTTKGTPHYMSPEQVAGSPDLGPTSDIFALGSVLYELLTGKVLFTGESLVAVLFAVARAEVEEILAPLDDAVEGLSFVLGKCLEKDADERYQNAEVLAGDLRRLRDGIAGASDIKEYLYALRGAMLAGQPPVQEDSDDPEFATLLVHDNVSFDKDLAAEIAETKRAADQVIDEQGGIRLGDEGVAAASETVADASVDDETLAATPSRADLVASGKKRKRKKAATPDINPAMATRADIRPTAVYKSGDTPDRKRKRFLALLSVAILAVVAGTIFLLTRPTPVAPVAVIESTPTPAGLDRLPDLTLPPEPKPTPRAKETEPRPRRDQPTPRPTPGSRPTPAPVVVEATPEPLPVELAGPTPAPTPEPVAAIEGTGVLKARASKPFALVFVDGRDTGEKTPLFGGIKLSAGKHTVELRSPERGEAVKKTIEIKPNATFVLDAYDFENKRWMK